MLNDPLMRYELVKAEQRKLWQDAELARHVRSAPPNPPGVIERVEATPALSGLVERVLQNVWKRLGFPVREPGFRPDNDEAIFLQERCVRYILRMFHCNKRKYPMRAQVRLVLVCIPLLVLAACGGTTAAQPTPTSAVGWTVYTSPDHKYQLSYPTGWQVNVADGNPGKVDFSGPNQNFEVSDDASTTPGGDPAQLITDWCNAIGQNTSQVRGTPVVLAGQTWFKAECGDDAQPTEPLIVEVVTYQGAVYQINYASSAASFQADDTSYYAPMEQSFQFLT